MDKELMEILEKLNNMLEKEIKNFEKTEGIKEKINEAFKEKAVISIKKHENGTAKTHIEGTNLAVLITLAGLEKTVIEKLKVPNEIWEMIKNIVGTREAEDNE